MNTRLCGLGIVLIVCAAAIGCVTYQYPPSSGRPEVVDVAPAPAGGSDQPFYDDLAPYGRWVYVSGPGWVWSPYNLQASWRPYQLGHWVFTDYGWTWASDEQWGWAVYHYGRWHRDGSYGWVWVPGTEWGPAWVAWNEGGGYVGWAPLPWQVRFRADVGLDWGGVSVSIDPSWWCFVGARNLVDVSLRTHIMPASRNVTIIQVTKNVTNYTYIDNRVVNQGVKVEKIGRAVGHTIPRYRVTQDDLPAATRGGKVKGNDFVVFRPDPERVRKSRGRPDPPGHEVKDRYRDMRDAAEDRRQQVAPPATQPEQTNAEPPSQNEPPAMPPGQENKDQNQNPRENRGRKFLDELRGKQPPPRRSPQGATPDQPAQPNQPSNPTSQPDATAPPAETRPGNPPPGERPGATTPPATREPAKADAAKERMKNAKEEALKARKGKSDKSKSDDSKKDDPKEEKPDSGN